MSMTGEVTVTGEEVAEAINVLYGGDFRLARVSEYGFYTGEDQLVSALDHESVAFDMTEAIYAQLATHRCTTGDDLSESATVVTNEIVYRNAQSLLFE